MNWTPRVIFSGLSLLLCADAIADTGAADFAAIARRNAFRLNPPSLSKAPAVVQPALPKVSLRGVTTLPGAPEAVLGIQDKASQAEAFCRLGEGQTEVGVTVRRIDMDSGTVWILNSGVEQMLVLRE